MRYLLIFLLFSTSTLLSLERAPWTKNDLVLYPRFTAIERLRPHAKSSLFYRPGIYGAYAPWMADLEITFADTGSHQGFDSCRLTGGYLWSNDIIGDPLSTLFGLSYIATAKGSLRDTSSFHHGRNEGELFVSIGKERTRGSSWTSRWWSVFCMGVADHGSPWMRKQLFWEKNFCGAKILRLYVDALWGMGGNKLHSKDFDGYGSIRHRSVEVGARITTIFSYGTEMFFEYGRRVYAFNYPKHSNFFRLQIVYPYSL